MNSNKTLLTLAVMAMACIAFTGSANADILASWDTWGTEVTGDIDNPPLIAADFEATDETTTG